MKSMKFRYRIDQLATDRILIDFFSFFDRSSCESSKIRKASTGFPQF